LNAILNSCAFFGVRDLDLGHNDIQDEGAWMLASCRYLSDLRSLRLTACQIGDAGLSALATSPYLGQLTLLDVTNNPIGDVGIRSVLESSGLRSLQRLIHPGAGISFRTQLDVLKRYNHPDNPGS
jgi:hypothetical protein